MFPVSFISSCPSLYCRARVPETAHSDVTHHVASIFGFLSDISVLSVLLTVLFYKVVELQSICQQALSQMGRDSKVWPLERMPKSSGQVQKEGQQSDSGGNQIARIEKVGTMSGRLSITACSDSLETTGAPGRGNAQSAGTGKERESCAGSYAQRGWEWGRAELQRQQP